MELEVFDSSSPSKLRDPIKKITCQTLLLFFQNKSVGPSPSCDGDKGDGDGAAFLFLIMPIITCMPKPKAN